MNNEKNRSNIIRCWFFTFNFYDRVREQNAAGWGPFSPVFHFTMLGTNDVASGMSLQPDEILKNYPNPFTSSTIIEIAPNIGASSLIIYDMLGREVADLSKEARSGSTTIAFDGSRLPAGIYTMILHGAARSQSKLMILEK